MESSSQQATKQRVRASHRLYSQWSGFCSRTTIHGLSHMYQAKTPKRRIIWLVIFALGLTATVVHLTFHAIQFLKSPTTITMDHEAAEFEFPDVTICPQTPTTGRFYERGTTNFPNVKFGFTALDFLLYPLYNQTYYTLHSLPYKEEIRLHRRLVQHQIASMATKHKGFALEELVIKCAYHKSDCRRNFTLLQSPYYLNCYTFQPTERNIKTTRPEDGLVLLLYTGSKHKDRLQEERSDAVIDSTSRSSTRQREQDTDWFARILVPEYEPAGIKVVIHERDAFPAPRSAGSIVGTGQFSEVVIDMVQEQKLNKAATPCLEAEEPKVWLLASVDSNGWPEFRQYNAEPADCAYALKQQDLYKECGCTSHHMPLQQTHGLFSGTIDQGDSVGWCYNATSLILDLGLGWDAVARLRNPDEIIELSRSTVQASRANRQLVDRYLQRVACHDQMLRRFSDPHYTYRPCPAEKRAFACQSNEYSSIYSTASWPRQSDIQEIIEEDILPALRLPEAGKYKPLAHDLFDIDDTGRWTARSEVLRRNFVKLQMHALEVRVNVHRERPAYSIWEALGELGGIIGLWLGVSFLGVIELLEFAMDFATTAKKITTSSPPSSSWLPRSRGNKMASRQTTTKPQEPEEFDEAPLSPTTTVTIKRGQQQQQQHQAGCEENGDEETSRRDETIETNPLLLLPPLAADDPLDT